MRLSFNKKGDFHLLLELVDFAVFNSAKALFFNYLGIQQLRPRSISLTCCWLVSPVSFLYSVSELDSFLLEQALSCLLSSSALLTEIPFLSAIAMKNQLIHLFAISVIWLLNGFHSLLLPWGTFKSHVVFFLIRFSYWLWCGQSPYNWVLGHLLIFDWDWASYCLSRHMDLSLGILNSTYLRGLIRSSVVSWLQESE